MEPVRKVMSGQVESIRPPHTPGRLGRLLQLCGRLPKALAGLSTGQAGEDQPTPTVALTGDALKIRTIMTRAVEAIPQSMPLSRLIGLFAGRNRQSGHSTFPVVDEDGRLVGIVSWFDMPCYTAWEDLGWLIVADVMSASPVLVALPDDEALATAHRLLDADLRLLPVVLPTEPDRLVGVVSLRDLLRALVG